MVIQSFDGIDVAADDLRGSSISFVKQIRKKAADLLSHEIEVAVWLDRHEDLQLRQPLPCRFREFVAGICTAYQPPYVRLRNFALLLVQRAQQRYLGCAEVKEFLRRYLHPLLRIPQFYNGLYKQAWRLEPFGTGATLSAPEIVRLESRTPGTFRSKPRRCWPASVRSCWPRS